MTDTMKIASNKTDANFETGMKHLGLTEREIQILRQLVLGKLDKEISIDFMISIRTVNHHVSRIILKLEATNRTHAVAKALLTKQVEMRASDNALRVIGRRLEEREKMAQVIASNRPESVGGERRG